MADENEFKDLTLEQWEDRVFLNAITFSVWQPEGVPRSTFATPKAAFDFALDKPRALVYAITKSGRSCALVRKRWAHYLTLRWKQDKSIRTYRMTVADRANFNPDEFTKKLKAAGFKLDSETCPVKITKPWDNVDGENGDIIWRQWDA